ncbi:hypothetical protein Glove_408g17 [Diversispora epigaea]|uniref:Uncharacterized protein n=1 Tax=Diversispora epigaea TaxID=1348612 RepID=A0A397GZ85_9GLOM|nr:hypothetical protein Glove_408g17 [Diversispora epigaea]
MAQYWIELIGCGNYSLRQIERPYRLDDPWEISILNIYQMLRQEAQQRNRIMALVYGYYLGEIIQLSVTPRDKWKEFARENKILNEYYFYLGATRTYQLFEKDSKRMYQTLTLTFKAISRMKKSDYRELLQYGNSVADDE